MVGVNTSLLLVIGAAFWRQDWRYSLPTTRPDGFYQPAIGSRPGLPADLAALRRPGRPMLVHFASSECPCTQFNLDHVRSLQQAFGEGVDFVAVLDSRAAPEEATREFESLHLRMPVLIDPDGHVGAALGVYGTPQAALLDATGRLFYRGNYNRSRYCLDESSEFVRIALTALAAHRPLPTLPQEAFITFGCPLRTGAGS